ncbi:transglycosylase domain-containing protein [Chitinispirillales bacterium ANBcel5]|uniref:biosynthetic peptidoglycan transglycosylase n=1 Tax=Cellulosispirillum alkaliphilum TaxID=3039283 RepID=UPI002A50DC97|nr:transglycosylase domain-containing protein [Chitinispirillales bacterium ANBcel5]
MADKEKKEKKKRSLPKRLLILIIVLSGLALVATVPGYMAARFAFNRYFEHWGDRLVDLEKRGLLSTEYGAGWQDVLMDKAMELEAQRIIQGIDSVEEEEAEVVDGIILSDYPSLSVVKLLREIREYSNTILITDRNDHPLTTIKTNHQRARIDEFPQTLITALIAAEDQNFWENDLGFEFDSFARAAIMAAKRSALNFRRAIPRGTSTITQQVAKLFISRLDEVGRREVSTTVDRKVRELRLAVALRKLYSAEEILEVYMNHSVTSDYGLIGYKDIANGLFGKELHELSDAECIYLARMVKWGRNVRPRIIEQCRIDMPRMGDALGWSEEKREEVLEEIENLTFTRPQRVRGDHGPLVDLANEFWLKTLRQNGSSEEQIAQMDLIDPNSLVRRKGNLTLKLSIDLPLQRKLEELVDARGYGPDTTIHNEVRIGSFGENVTLHSPPRDTVRSIQVLTEQRDLSEPGSSYITTLEPGDTLIKNIRYRELDNQEYRRSIFYYTRMPQTVDGQYYAYSIMDSRTGKLLAYYSRDRLGSRLIGLLRNRVPNGSATAKPILNALNYDLGIFRPYSRWTDTEPVKEDVPWSREINYSGGRPIGVIFDQTAVRGRGYRVHNYGRRFAGCQYVFDLLNTSNNILGVETIYRLNQRISDNGEIPAQAFPLVNLLYRLGAYSRITDELNMDYVTGVRVYKEISRIIGAEVDSMRSGQRRVPISDSLYSVALGTLEMSLYEQMHVFNMLYNNELIENPAEQPSLVLESITLNGNPVAINDTIRRFRPLSDINSIRPTLLGLHKRLVSHPGDGLTAYDIAYTPDLNDPVYNSESFHEDAFYIDESLSNFAKSGTTDEVIRPFNVDASSDKRTNYGLWNAVVRVDLSKFSGAEGPEDIRDLTVASIGEGNMEYTGARDGKSLHKFLTIGLLREAGIRAPNGFYSQYESYIRSVTPEAEKNCEQQPVTVPVDTGYDEEELEREIVEERTNGLPG